MKSYLIKNFLAYKITVITIAFNIFVCIVYFVSNKIEILEPYKVEVLAFILGIIGSSLVNYFHELLNIHNKSESILSDLINLVEIRGRKHFPRMDFNSSNILTSDSFNQEISLQLSLANKYFFHGVTARHVGMRLCSLFPPIRIKNVFVQITHPDNLDNNNVYVINESKINNIDKKKQLQTIRDDIIFSIFCLNEASKICNIKISLSFKKNATLNRFEMLDKSIFLSIFDDTTEGVSKFPKSYLFDEDSIWYQYATNEYNSILALQEIYYINSYNDSQLVNFFNDINLMIDESHLATMRNKFHVEIVNYRKFAK